MLFRSKFSLSDRLGILDELIIAIEKKPVLGNKNLSFRDELRSFISLLVPFTKEQKGFGRRFTIIYLGQNPEVVNAGSSGLLGGGYIRGGILGIIGYSFFVSFLLRWYRYIIRVIQSSDNFNILFDFIIYHLAWGALTSNTPIAGISGFIKMVIILKAYSIIPKFFSKGHRYAPAMERHTSMARGS